MMNIAGSEWIIIILLGLILLFGTKKLPQVSRTFGKAVGEYEKAKEMFRREMQEAEAQARTTESNSARSAARTFATGTIPRITGQVGSEREKLETIASSLGIDHAGKTDQELRSLISEKIES